MHNIEAVLLMTAEDRWHWLRFLDWPRSTCVFVIVWMKYTCSIRQRRFRHSLLQMKFLLFFLSKNAISSYRTYNCSDCRAISAAYALARCPSVCQSVCLSVTRLFVLKWVDISSNFFSPWCSHIILVFPYKILWHFCSIHSCVLF